MKVRRSAPFLRRDRPGHMAGAVSGNRIAGNGARSIGLQRSSFILTAAGNHYRVIQGCTGSDLHFRKVTVITAKSLGPV